MSECRTIGIMSVHARVCQCEFSGRVNTHETSAQTSQVTFVNRKASALQITINKEENGKIQKADDNDNKEATGWSTTTMTTLQSTRKKK